MKKTNQTQQTEEIKPVNKPTNKYTIFPITITEWENNDIKSYTIDKSYKDANGEWKNTQQFTEADLCVISAIIGKI